MEYEHGLKTSRFTENNLAAEVARILREMFLNGELKPGQRIIESEIADQLNLSRGPVRDAFKILEKEGVVKIFPRRGTFVVEMSPEDVYEIYSLRGVIEGLAARILAANADPEVVAQLNEFIEGMEESKDDLVEFAKIDLQFHETLCSLARHKWLYKQWLSMKTYIWLFIRAVQNRNPLGDEHLAVEVHRNIVEAIRAGLPELAELVARRHSEVYGEALRLHWEKEGWSSRTLFSGGEMEQLHEPIRPGNDSDETIVDNSVGIMSRRV